ncbi:GNAT family N-acetyltransferase [Candidatus Sumerlaeota bacterium]|nr:GNAT family N-acetyltransferase [Candidatus Sumerlaeota bacterium]
MQASQINESGGQPLQFRPLSAFQAGTIHDLLSECYASLLADLSEPEHRAILQRQWQETDQFAFAMKDTPVGDCFFITCRQDVPIGMGSFDPRSLPGSASIGQNCVLPAYRGKGYGKFQLRHILALLRLRHASKIIVVTSAHPFFLPAQRMYQSCGFQETCRFPGVFAECIQYELTLA